MLFRYKTVQAGLYTIPGKKDPQTRFITSATATVYDVVFILVIQDIVVLFDKSFSPNDFLTVCGSGLFGLT